MVKQAVQNWMFGLHIFGPLSMKRQWVTVEIRNFFFSILPISEIIGRLHRKYEDFIGHYLKKYIYLEEYNTNNDKYNLIWLLELEVHLDSMFVGTCLI